MATSTESLASATASDSKAAVASSSSSGSAFVLEHLSKQFGETEVLSDLNLSIQRGERVALIGPSGAGKTTLLRLLVGTIAPSSGSVLALGQSTQGLQGSALKRLRQRIGVLYQSENLIPSLRVVHNVLMGRLPRWNVFKSILSLIYPMDAGLARKALARVELEDRLWAQTEELSGGQQQRVAIARLIVQEPEVLLADEPVSSLDVRLGREVIGLLAELAAEANRTLIVSLHTLDLLGTHFDRVIALKDGKLFWDGATFDLSREMLGELYGDESGAIHLNDLHLPAWQK